MSQIYKAGIAGSPSVPTSFMVDQQDTVTTALPVTVFSVVPQSNILRLGGDNGIVTYQVTQNAGDLLIGYIQGSGTTDGSGGAGDTVDLITQPVSNNSSMTFQFQVTGYCTTDNTALGVFGAGTVINVAGAVTIANTVEFFRNATSLTVVAPLLDPINTSVISIVPSGSNFIVRVTGVLGLSIDWGAILPAVVAI
jgi:hypothetical protein